MKLPLRTLVSSLAIATAAMSTASAQVVEPPPIPPRHGLFLSGALWGGNLSCDGSDCGGFRAAGGGSTALGWSVSPRLAVLFDLWAMTSSKNQVSVTFVTTTIDVRYWIAPRLWIEGGIGNGHAAIHASSLAAVGDNVPVGELAAGLELVRGRRWDLTAAFQLAQGTATTANGGTTTGRSTGLGVMLTWYPGR